MVSQRSSRPTNDATPNPRRQAEVIAREAEYERSARPTPTRPSVPSGRTRSRFDDAPPVSESSIYADRDMMDVDTAPRSQISTPPSNDGQSRPLPSGYSERDEVVPRGPRAMSTTTKISAPNLQQSYSKSPASPEPTVSIRGMPQELTPAPRTRGRPPRQTSVIDDDRRDHSDVYATEPRSSVVQQDAQARKHEDGRQLPYASPPHRPRVRQEQFAEPPAPPHVRSLSFPSVVASNLLYSARLRGYVQSPFSSRWPSPSIDRD